MATTELKIVGLKRRGAGWVLAFLKERGCVIVKVAPALWMARRRIEQEIGGNVPRPFGKRGQIAVLFLLCMGTLLAMMLLVFQYSVLALTQERLQCAVDLATAAGASFLPNDSMAARDAAQRLLRTNAPSADAQIETSGSTIGITAAQPVDFIGSTQVMAHAEATAAPTTLNPHRSEVIQ